MDPVRVGVIGTGKKPVKPGPLGYGMAHQHGAAYQALPQCVMTACADIVEQNARAFADIFHVPKIYTDYHEMLAKEKLDIVSICTWPHLHAQMAIDTAKAGVPAIHCEKPMAYSWGDCKRMAEECEKLGCRLTFNHQRRFGAPFRKAKALIDSGVIGKLFRLEFGAGDLYEYGTHNFDMLNYFNNETASKWAIGQVDYRDEKVVFGTHNENQAFVMWEYQNGVFGMGATGASSPMVGCHYRLLGSGGVIEIGSMAPNTPPLRFKRWDGRDWEIVDCGKEGVHGPGYIERAIADVVDALQKGRESELCARNALKATETIFACFESVRRRGRVDLPLTIADNPLHEMVLSGDLKPKRKA